MKLRVVVNMLGEIDYNSKPLRGGKVSSNVMCERSRWQRVAQSRRLCHVLITRACFNVQSPRTESVVYSTSCGTRCGTCREAETQLQCMLLLLFHTPHHLLFSC